jgi:hypothetical protein
MAVWDFAGWNWGGNKVWIWCLLGMRSILYKMGTLRLYIGKSLYLGMFSGVDLLSSTLCPSISLR